MRKIPLVKVPVNGDYQAQLDFEKEYDFVSAHDCSRLDVAKTLITNRIHRENYTPGYGPVMHGIADDGRRILDHYCLYKTMFGKFYFTAQPYIGPPLQKYTFDDGFDYEFEETVCAVSKWCNENGLDLDIKIPGPHNSETTLFIISKHESERL